MTFKQKTIGIFTLFSLFATPALSENWKGEPNMGAQGIQGALVYTQIDGDYNLTLSCSAKEGQNRTVYFQINTPIDSILELGNETSFPMHLNYHFKNGTKSRQDFMLNYLRTKSDIFYWSGSFPLNKKFLHDFSSAQTMELMDFNNQTVYLYHMNGSSKASAALIKFCYSGDYS